MELNIIHKNLLQFSKRKILPLNQENIGANTGDKIFPWSKKILLISRKYTWMNVQQKNLIQKKYDSQNALIFNKTIKFSKK